MCDFAKLYGVTVMPLQAFSQDILLDIIPWSVFSQVNFDLKQ